MPDDHNQPEASEGKIIDFIDGKPRLDNELEQVRQNFERTLIEEYRFDKSDVAADFRIRIPDGSRSVSRTLPLAVFRAGAKAQDQDSLHILIYIAKPGVQPTDDKGGAGELEKALVACTSAEFACWTNGVETIYFQKKKAKFDTDILPVNDFPRKGEDASSIFTTDRSRLRVATGTNLLNAFKRCHDFIHANQGGSKEQIFWEFLKILFAKIEDEQHDGRPRFAIRNSDERNASPGQKEVKDRVEQLFREVCARKEFRPLFTDTTQGILFNDAVVTFIVAQLEKYDFIHSSVDVKGVAYETIVGPTLEGAKGEFFTPRNVVKMVVKMLDPGPGKRIFDPACGTGGFLVVAFNYVSEKLRQTASRTWKAKEKPTLQEERALFAEIHETSKFIFGADFNANLVKTAQMNMVMNNDGRGGLFALNALWKPTHWASKEAQDILELGTMDFVMANPPFGTSIKVEGEEVLEQYDVAHSWESSDKRWTMTGKLKTAMPPEVLFIERCIQFLKPGTGRLGMVVPNGLLGTPENEYLRAWILSQCEIIASIQLPVETFLPRTGTQTSVLILRRLSEQEKLARSFGKPSDYNIFMCSSRSIGKNRRGALVYIRDDRGVEINKRDAYIPAAQQTLLNCSPTVESTGKVLDDDLWACASLFRGWSENGRQPAPIPLHCQSPITDIPYRCSAMTVTPSLVRVAGFRLNAESYVSNEHYIRLERATKNTIELKEIADVFTVYLQSPLFVLSDDPKDAVTKPFLTPSDMQKRNPRRRYVSLVADPRLAKLQVSSGWILLSGSGTVGHVTLVTKDMHGTVVRGDMLRVAPRDPKYRGYIYFFLRSKFGDDFFNMKTYGSVVEHLHPEEVKTMKVARPGEKLLEELNHALDKLVACQALIRQHEELGEGLVLTAVEKALG